MITEKLLDKIDVGYRLRMGDVADDEADEIEQLVRLGLWARDVARPALKSIYDDYDVDESIAVQAEIALASYPGGEEQK